MRVRYKDLPDTLDSEIRRLVGAWKHVLPTWVQTLTVTYDDTDPDDYATSCPMYEQRVALVSFHPAFWSLDPEQRAITLLHEFCHICLSPVDATYEALRDQGVKNPRLAAWADEQYRQSNEAVVSDLAAAFLRTMTTTTEEGR